MNVRFDPELSDFDIAVYNWMAKSIREGGPPMKQAVIANKLRCARATVRNALIELDRRGYISFTRFKPQLTTLPDPGLVLFNNEAANTAAIAAQMFQAKPPEVPVQTRRPWDR